MCADLGEGAEKEERGMPEGGVEQAETGQVSCAMETQPHRPH